MRFVVQRVSSASVEVEGSITGKIDKGFFVLIGVEEADDVKIADKMISKLIGLRISFRSGCGRRSSAGIPVYSLCGLQKG